VKEINHDDERLAALLGGRLEGPEREELLAHLLANGEDYQVFADTAAILQEAEDEEAAQGQQPGEQVDAHPPFRDTVPPSARPGWRRRAPRWIAIPAVLAGLVVTGIFVSRGQQAAGEPLRVAARLENGQRLPRGWSTDTRPWGGARGDGSTGTGIPKAVQAGALLVDLAVAVRSGDVDDIQTLALKLREYNPQASSALDQIAANPGASPTMLQPLLEKAESRLEERMDNEALRLGAWTEAALLAAGARDAEFFRTGPTQQMLRQADRFTRDDPGAQEALASVRTALPAEREPDWDVLAPSLRRLLGAMGS
jgi:hypothetical protein